jgi:hypothetical protein
MDCSKFSYISFGGENVAWCWRFICRSKERQARSPNHHPTAKQFVLLVSLTRRIINAIVRVPRLLVYAQYTRFPDFRGLPEAGLVKALVFKVRGTWGLFFSPPTRGGSQPATIRLLVVVPDASQGV